MQLIVGTLSTWSMRAWLCLKMAQMSFEEVVIALGQPGYQTLLRQHSDTLLVPVLKDHDLVVHDSLAIAEYINEKSGGKLLPSDLAERALARSLCAELHAGFSKIRSLYPFGWTVVPVETIDPAVQPELDRLTAIWQQAQGDYFFAEPTMVDAFYALMAARLLFYNITLTGRAGAYQQALVSWPLFCELETHAKQWG